MTVRIVVPGRAKKHWRKKCPECSCVFDYQIKDCKRYRYTSIVGRSLSRHFIACPECKKECEV